MRLLAGNAAALLGTLAITFSPGLAGAQDFPSDNITMVIGWPAGGAQDTVGRLVAEHLGQHLSTTVVVSNVPGAAGANGVREVETATPDGYTIGTIGLHGIAQAYINENATAMDDIEPLALVNIDPAALTVRTDTGIGSLEEFIAYAKDNPGALINGNDSPGGFSFLNAEFIERNLEIELTKVPYQGFAPTVAALVAGEVESVTLPVPLLADLHEAGDVKILAVASAERHFAAPDVPTFQEEGIDYTFSDYVVIFGPKGLPADIKAALETSILAAMDTDGFKASADTIGLILDPQGADAARETITTVDEDVYPVMLDAGLVTTRQR